MSDPSAVKRYLPWVVATALFMEQLDSTIVNTAVPAMAASLQVTPLSLKAVVASYILSLAVCIPISGWMADRYGTRRVFSAAVALFTASSVLCGLSVNVPMLVAARVAQGIGAAMMMPVGRLTIVRSFPKHELLRAMNFVIVPALIGPLLGPTVGGLIVHWLSWREIFFVNIPVGLAAQWLIHRHPAYWEEPDQFRPERFLPGRDPGRPKFAYFPFGGGPRSCIGNTFALTEGALVLAGLAQRFQFRPADDQEMEPDLTFVLRPKRAVNLVVRKRT